MSIVKTKKNFSSSLSSTHSWHPQVYAQPHSLNSSLQSRTLLKTFCKQFAVGGEGWICTSKICLSWMNEVTLTLTLTGKPKRKILNGRDTDVSESLSNGSRIAKTTLSCWCQELQVGLFTVVVEQPLGGAWGRLRPFKLQSPGRIGEVGRGQMSRWGSTVPYLRRRREGGVAHYY